jgi:hypothetical protein
MPGQLMVNTDLTSDDLSEIAKKEHNPNMRQRLLAIRLVFKGNTVLQPAKLFRRKE